MRGAFPLKGTGYRASRSSAVPHTTCDIASGKCECRVMPFSFEPVSGQEVHSLYLGLSSIGLTGFASVFQTLGYGWVVSFNIDFGFRARKMGFGSFVAS